MLAYLARGEKIIDTMMTGREKLDANNQVCQLKARCALRGDQQPRADKALNTSPGIRCEGIKCCEANCVLREQDEIIYDYTGAYLQSRQLKELIARAPAGHRELDEDNVEFYWLMHVPLYGQQDAGLRWYETVTDFYKHERECNFEESELVGPGVLQRRKRERYGVAATRGDDLRVEMHL